MNTPTPEQLAKLPKLVAEDRFIFIEGGEMIAACEGSPGEDTDRAARLAKCWNEHDTLTAQVEWYREREKELKSILQQCVDVLDEYRNEFSAPDSRRREVSIKARELLR